MPLDKELVIKKIVEILKRIQQAGNYKEIEIDLNTCLIKAIPEFDSQIWIVSIAMLIEDLEIELPENVNIFLSEDGKDCLTLEQVAERVLKNAKDKGAQ